MGQPKFTDEGRREGWTVWTTVAQIAEKAPVRMERCQSCKRAKRSPTPNQEGGHHLCLVCVY